VLLAKKTSTWAYQTLQARAIGGQEWDQTHHGFGCDEPVGCPSLHRIHNFDRIDRRCPNRAVLWTVCWSPTVGGFELASKAPSDGPSRDMARCHRQPSISCPSRSDPSGSAGTVSRTRTYGTSRCV